MYTTGRGRQSGFTLVEIAIVLVIIGLLLGGILKGQEMITQARIKNVMNDFNGVTAAYFSYQDRYKAVPGDDPNAGTRWSTGFPDARQGSGNSVVGGTYDLPPPTGPLTASNDATESLNYWHHLRLAGFIPGPTNGQGSWTQPTNAVGGRVGVQTGALGLPGLVLCSSNIPDKIASAVDAQLDDQASNRGQMRAKDQNSGGPGIATNTTSSDAAANFQETGTNQYVICRSV